MLRNSISQQKTWHLSQTTKALLLALSLYLVWTFATYLLEGRLNLLQAPTLAGRYTYVLIANVLIGTVGALWLVRSFITSHVVTLEQIGFRPMERTAVSIVFALIIGLALLLIDPPPGLTSIVVVNGFAQTLPVSIAEIIVCWVVIGATCEAVVRPKYQRFAVPIGIIAANLSFSVYHIGHSAPFNQLDMMLLLLVPGFLTALFYFISREIYATIVFHNFLATMGVLSNLNDLTFLSRPLYPLYLLALISVLALIAAGVLIGRRSDASRMDL